VGWEKKSDHCQAAKKRRVDANRGKFDTESYDVDGGGGHQCQWCGGEEEDRRKKSQRFFSR